MAELRCLVCNNVNPENAESCQFCGAKLRQPTVPLGPIKVGDAPTPKSTADLEGTLPGWLRDIRSDNAAEGPMDSSSAMKPSAELFSGNRKPPSGPLVGNKKPPSGPLGSKSKAPSPSDFLAGLSSSSGDDEDEVPDWLASIKAPEPPLAPAPSVPASPSPADAPADWMSGLRAESEPEKPQQPEKLDFGFSARDTWLDETPQKPAPVEQTSEDVADWLRTLDQGPGKAPAQPAVPSAPAPASFPAADEAVPDWLSGLEHTGAIPSAAAPVEQPAAASDWFTPAPAAEPAAPSDSAPDWLSSLEAPATPAPVAAEPASNLPDWFSDLNQPAAETPAPAATSAPDWLSDLNAPAAETSAAAVDMPDWMSGSATPIAPAQPAADMPDWMSSLGAPATPAQPPPASDMPDWMTGPGAPAAPAQAVPAADMPDWMSSLGAPATPAAAPADENVPDWMRGSAPVMPAAQESAAEGPSFEAPSWLSEEPATSAAEEPVFPATEMPSWMAGFGAVEAAAPEPATPAPAQPESDAGRTKASAFILDDSSVASGAAEALLSMDMPDWLAGIAPAESATPMASAAAEQPLASSAAEAELPSWVKAMRPVESMMDASGPAEDSYVESQGPLAGLRDVLPVVAGLPSVQKPRAYANRLELTDSQQMQSNLLETLIAAEAAPKASTTQKRAGSARGLRWALAALVLLAVIAPMIINILGTQTVPSISNTRSLGQTAAAFETINALQANAAVLLVFDYEPGLAGELEAAALPLIEHANLKGARLIAISSAPSGPLLAERVFAQFASSQFKAGEQYSNLGYVAGGVTGVASFAAAPQQAAPFDNARAWSAKALENVKAYSDFAVVVIITDNAETGRAWIEQTAPLLNGKPMLIVSSAQAEPLLWPYYSSHQVRGLVSGLTGGAYYSDVLLGSSQFKLGRAYWDAFGYSLTLAILALLIGGLVSLIMHFRARAAEGDEA